MLRQTLTRVLEEEGMTARTLGSQVEGCMLSMCDQLDSPYVVVLKKTTKLLGSQRLIASFIRVCGRKLSSL
jgi:hypothetical protein